MIGAAILVAATAAVAGCAHTRVKQVNGCWLRETENRWGDTAQSVSVCEPKTPPLSDDPLVRSTEVCLYQAQLAWYNDSIQRLRTGKDPSLLPDWTKITADCANGAQGRAMQRIHELEAQVGVQREQERQLEEENKDLRASLIKCAEKTPNAYATANANTESKSDANSQHSSHTQDTRQDTRNEHNDRPSSASPGSATPSTSNPNVSSVKPQIAPTACEPATIKTVR
jgi:hypothetical protein